MPVMTNGHNGPQTTWRDSVRKDMIKLAATDKAGQRVARGTAQNAAPVDVPSPAAVRSGEE